MSISKKIRFEVFKRDGFKCAYCGKTPPQVSLEIDHVDPKSKGGTDDINNLLTSCFDCNRGKRDIPLQTIPQTLTENLEVLKEKEKQISEYNKFVRKIQRREKEEIEEICRVYTTQYPEWSFSETFRNASLKTFLSKLPLQEVINSLQIAIGKYPTDNNTVIPYFCGICWNKIRGVKHHG